MVSWLIFSLGANRSALDGTAALAVCLSTAIFATTIHAQDFKDVYGDALVGRKTLPIVHPKYSRQTILIGLSVWSLSLNIIWGLDSFTGALLMLLAMCVGVRFMVYKTVPDDQFSFYLYNVRPQVPVFRSFTATDDKPDLSQVWLSCAHALPGYWRGLH